MKNYCKYTVILLLVVLTLLTTGCGGDTIQGVYYDSYGVANMESRRDPHVLYEISAASVIWGILLCETIVVPIYIVGWDLYTPVRIRTVN